MDDKLFYIFFIVNQLCYFTVNYSAYFRTLIHFVIFFVARIFFRSPFCLFDLFQIFFSKQTNNLSGTFFNFVPCGPAAVKLSHRSVRNQCIDSQPQVAESLQMTCSIHHKAWIRQYPLELIWSTGISFLHKPDICPQEKFASFCGRGWLQRMGVAIFPFLTCLPLFRCFLCPCPLKFFWH